jgi:Domain of unknown function (DUF4279)
LSSLWKTVVTLRFFGDDLEPSEISTLLATEPTASERKGDVRTSSPGMEIVARTGSWRLSVDDRSPGDLDAQLGQLFSRLTPDLSVWEGLAQRFQSDVFCGLFMETSNDGEKLKPETLASLGSRGLSLSLDIYDPTPSD